MLTLKTKKLPFQKKMFVYLKITEKLKKDSLTKCKEGEREREREREEPNDQICTY